MRHVSWNLCCAVCHRALLGFYFSKVPVSFRVLWHPADFVLVSESDGLVLHLSTPCWSHWEAGLGLKYLKVSEDTFSRLFNKVY